MAHWGKQTLRTSLGKTVNKQQQQQPLVMVGESQSGPVTLYYPKCLIFNKILETMQINKKFLSYRGNKTIKIVSEGAHMLNLGNKGFKVDTIF